ncbi:hypothetical protein FACS1894130_00310 [Spirochaetia bacterium]|nr:hypothetical protein FACS1894130_00310 [Spirochaetia bacterium]
MLKTRNALRIKLILFSIVIVMVPMIILYLMILTFFYTRSLRENERYAYHNIQSISQTLDSAFAGLNEMTLYMLVNPLVHDYLVDPSTPMNTTYAQVNSSLQFLPFSSKYYHSIAVISEGRQSLISGLFYDIKITPEEREKADHLHGGSFMSVQPNSMAMIRLVRDFNHLSTGLGYTKILINLSALQELLSFPEDLPEMGYVLISADGLLLQTGEVPMDILQRDELRFENLTNRKHDNAPLKAAGNAYLYSSRSIFNGKLAVVSLIDRSKLYRMDSLLLVSIIAALFMSAAFVIILVRYYTKWVFDPLSRLGEVMLNIEQKNFETDFSISGNNEISVLVEQFNFMCRRLKMLYEQIYLGELKLREAELAVLQSKINPHFLYNTLDTIYWMSKMSRTREVSEMVQSLSRLFRIAIEQSEGGLVPLSVEEEYIRCYLTIQKVRYQEKITFEFYVQDGIGNLPVLKLLLQPIVENAIIHGVEPAGTGRIVINMYREDDVLVYTVFNTGSPVDIGEMERLMAEGNTSNRGLAVRNVNTRIRMRFGTEYGLYFENLSGGGVLVTLRQPVDTKAGHT